MAKKKKEKKEKLPKFTVIGEEIQSDVGDFRTAWLKKGYELVDITQLCELKLGHSGWANEFNQPDDKIYHIQIWYRHEQVAVIGATRGYVIEDNKYAMFTTNTEDPDDGDFTIFKLCKVIKDE